MEKKDLQIECKSKEEICCLFQFFKAHGIYISQGGTDIEDISKLANYYWTKKWHWIIYRVEEDSATGNNEKHPECLSVSFSEFFGFFRERGKKIEVPLNKTHTAIVSRDGIKVGCQTFPLEIIDQLQKAKEQIK